MNDSKPTIAKTLFLVLFCISFLGVASLVYVQGVVLPLAVSVHFLLIGLVALFSAVRIEFVFLLLLVSVTMSSLFTSFWAPLGIQSNSLFLLSNETKTVLILLTGLLVVLVREYRKEWIRIAWPFICLAILAVVRLTSIDLAALAYSRNFITPCLIVAIGIHFSNTITFHRFNVTLKTLTIIMFFAFLIEEAIGLTSWSEFLSLEATTKIKGPTSLITGVGGFSLHRSIGLVGNPITLSYILAALTFWHIANRQIIYSFCSLLPLFFTFGKSGFLTLGIAVIWYLYFTKRKSVRTPLLVFCAFSLLPLPLFALYNLITSPTSIVTVLVNPLSFFLGGSTAITHFVGLFFGLKNAITNPFGMGTGKGGNFNNLFGEVDRATWIQSGSESSIGVIGFQLGILGVLLFIYGMYRLLSSVSKSPDNDQIKYFGLLFGWFAASFFSENALGPSSSFLPIIIGMYLTRNTQFATRVRRYEAIEQ